MTTAFINLLSEVFENVNNLDPDQVKKLALESTTFLGSLRDKMASSDTKVQEQARSEALEIQQFLEGQIVKLAQAGGMDLEQVIAMAQDPAFKEQVFADLQKMEAEMAGKGDMKVNHFLNTNHKKIKIRG